MASILIVDDYTVTQRVISYLLQKNGHSVAIASNGSEALVKLANTLYDLAIIDVAMPGMDGLTLLRHIRADTGLNSLPIIMLTASGDDQHRVAATSAGVEAFLTKPASSRELLGTVNRCLQDAANGQLSNQNTQHN